MTIILGLTKRNRCRQIIIAKNKLVRTQNNQFAEINNVIRVLKAMDTFYMLQSFGCLGGNPNQISNHSSDASVEIYVFLCCHEIAFPLCQSNVKSPANF